MRGLLLLIVAILPGFAPAARADKADEVELALAALGIDCGATPRQFTDRLFSQPLTFIGSEQRAQALAALPADIREQRLSPGKTQRRVEASLRDVLRAQNRDAEQVALVLYRDRMPHAMLWRGCVLALSDGLVAALPDGQL